MNRFNQFIRTDYIGLPVDYYQMAVGAGEQEKSQQLAATKQTIDAARNVEAVYNPDKELKQSLLGDLDSKVAELAKENLTAPQTLMKLGQIVDDRELIGNLSGIQTNTNNYRKLVEAAKKYRETYGNDINLARMEDQIAAYNKLDKSGFKSGFMDSYQPDKFVDIVGDIQKVLKDEKADVNSIKRVNGQWLITRGDKTLSLDKLLADAGVQTKDPKYQTQLNNLLYYNARSIGGGDIQKGMETYYNSTKTDLAEVIDATNAHIAGLKKANVKGKNDEDIKAAEADLEKMRERQVDLGKMNAAQAFQTGFTRDLAMMAASPYDYNETTIDREANPYALARYKSDLDLRNWFSKYQRTRKDKLDDIKEENYRNTPHPTISSVRWVDSNNAEHNQAVAWFEKKGGYETEGLANTIGALLNSTGQDVIMTAEGQLIKKGDIKLGSRKTAAGDVPIRSVQEGIKDGTIQVGYLPGTEQYWITTPEGNYRIKSDLNMQKEMAPLYKLYGDKPIYDFSPERMQVSLDGKNLSDVFITKDADSTDIYRIEKETSGKDKTYDVKAMGQKDFNKLVGIDFKSNMTWQTAVPGIYVAYDGVGHGANDYVKRFNTLGDYKKDLSVMDVKGHRMFYSDGKTLTPLESVSGGLEGSDIIGAHMTYMTQDGRGLSFLKSKDANKTIKTSQTHKESESEGEGESDNLPVTN